MLNKVLWLFLSIHFLGSHLNFLPRSNRVSNTSFSGCLEFVSESHVPPSLDVCPSRHVTSLILPSLGVMPKIPTALHLPVAHIDDITRLIAIYNDTYKFAAYPNSIFAGICS